MQRKKLEALAEAISRYSSYYSPESNLYLARNPGGLKAYSPLQLRDEDGFRVFASVIDGMQALFFDTQLKLEGKSKAHLRPKDTLQDFAVACGQPSTAAQAYAGFLRKALHTENINQKTLLQFFLED